MATNLTLKGTQYPSFQVGPGGPTIYQGTAIPANSVGIDGDVFFLAAGSGSGIYFKGAGVWKNATGNTSIGTIAPGTGVFIIGNGTAFQGYLDNDVKTFLGLGTQQVAEFTGVTLGNNGATYQSAPGVTAQQQVIMYATTTNATPTGLFLDGTSQLLLLPDDTTCLVEIKLAARRTDVEGESDIFWFEGGIDRQTGAATAAMIGTRDLSQIEQQTNWNFSVGADIVNGGLNIQVQGEVGKTIKWTAFVNLTQSTN